MLKLKDATESRWNAKNPSAPFLLPPLHVLKVQVLNEQNKNGHPEKSPKGETRKELY